MMKCTPVVRTAMAPISAPNSTASTATGHATSAGCPRGPAQLPGSRRYSRRSQRTPRGRTTAGRHSRPAGPDSQRRGHRSPPVCPTIPGPASPPAIWQHQAAKPARERPFRSPIGWNRPRGRISNTTAISRNTAMEASPAHHVGIQRHRHQLQPPEETPAPTCPSSPPGSRRTRAAHRADAADHDHNEHDDQDAVPMPTSTDSSGP